MGKTKKEIIKELEEMAEQLEAAQRTIKVVFRTFIKDTFTPRDQLDKFDEKRHAEFEIHKTITLSEFTALQKVGKVDHPVAEKPVSLSFTYDPSDDVIVCLNDGLLFERPSPVTTGHLKMKKRSHEDYQKEVIEHFDRFQEMIAAMESAGWKCTFRHGV